ncbi:MAG: hypothetical protein LC774_03130 [Acidobacteria bacterium]|nr:hypothetical protein [Acidobacteriota bacterium]MCA1635619.1 hypothetical protein [Acidobacteriota bacterium]
MANENQIGTDSNEPSEPDYQQGKVTNKERTADIGESGQHAPGGYYNQQGATQAERIDLDEQVDSALNREK